MSFTLWFFAVHVMGLYVFPAIVLAYEDYLWRLGEDEKAGWWEEHHFRIAFCAFFAWELIVIFMLYSILVSKVRRTMQRRKA